MGCEFGIGGGGEGVADMAFPEAVDQAVRADEEAVAGLVGDGGEMRVDIGVGAADDFIKGGTARDGNITLLSIECNRAALQRNTVL